MRNRNYTPLYHIDSIRSFLHADVINYTIANYHGSLPSSHDAMSAISSFIGYLTVAWWLHLAFPFRVRRWKRDSAPLILLHSTSKRLLYSVVAVTFRVRTDLFLLIEKKRYSKVNERLAEGYRYHHRNRHRNQFAWRSSNRRAFIFLIKLVKTELSLWVNFRVLVVTEVEKRAESSTNVSADP